MMKHKIYSTISIFTLLMLVIGCATTSENPKCEPASCEREPASCATALTGNPLKDYFKILNDVGRSQPTVQWESERLRPGLVSDRKRMAEIVRLVLYGDPALISEMDGFIAQLGGQTSAKFWNAYFQSYDKTVGFNQG